MSDTYRKCPSCGTMNLNRDYCKSCGILINTNLKRTQERNARLEKQKETLRNKEPNKITLLFEKAKVHPNGFVRFTAKFFYSVWILLLVIGGLIAFAIAYIAA